MKSIRMKIIILIVLSTVIVTSIVGVLLVEKTKDTFEKETIDKLKETVLRHSSEINREIEVVEELAKQVSYLVSSTFDEEELKNNPNHLDELEEKLAPSIKHIAERGISTKSAYIFFIPELDGKAHDIWFSDLNYDGIVNRQEEFPAEYYEEFIPGREWFFVPKETGKPYWTDPYAGNADYDAHIVYMSYTEPVFINDKFIGVVGSDYHFNLMKKRLEEISIYNTGYASLFNAKGEVLIHPTLGELTKLSDINEGEYTWLSDEMLSNEFGIVEYTWINHKEKIMAFSRLDNNWILVLTLEKKEVFKWIENLEKVMILTVFIGVLVVSIIGYKFGSVLTKPLNILSEQVKVIGNGDYGNKIPEMLLTREDETGELSRSIEIMRKLQKDTFDEIKKHTETLEEKVNERTESLIRTNTYLEETLGENEEKTAELMILNSELEVTLEHVAETQKQLIESEKIAALSFLVTGIAHEINTPIGNMLTLLTFLDRKKRDFSIRLIDNQLRKKDLHEFIKTLEDAYDLLIENINKTTLLINKFKELDPHTYISKETTINVCNFFDVVIDSMNINYEGGNFSIEVLCDKKLEIRIDSGKLSQIIIQLLENALYHAFVGCENGIIIIEVELIENYLSLIVKDNGIGMNQEEVEHIFLPFYTSVFSGKKSGLGLNIVYNIVTKIFSGNIKCVSSYDEGTSFYIRIYLDNQ